MNSVHPHSKSGSRRKASVITHHDHTRHIVDKLGHTMGRFEWTLQSLFSEIPLLRRSRASKAVDMTDEEDDKHITEMHILEMEWMASAMKFASGNEGVNNRMHVVETRSRHTIFSQLDDAIKLR